EAQWQGAIAQLVGERLGALLGEAARDAGTAVEDDAVHLGSGDDLPVEHERELIARRETGELVLVQTLADLAEDLGAVVVHRQLHGPLAGLWVATGYGVFDDRSVELLWSEEVFELVVGRTRDQRIGSWRVGRVV